MDDKNIVVEMYALKDFFELGQVETHSLETALSFVEYLSNCGINFRLTHKVCPIGEFWFFEKQDLNVAKAIV